MILREFFNRKMLTEGGNLELPGGHQAQQIDLKVHNRGYMVPVLNTLLYGINDAYAKKFGGPLWNPKTLSSKKFLSGSSLHFFNTDIPDDEFSKVKPKVGDIDTQVNKESEENLEQFLNSVQDKVVGNAKCLGFQRGNEQFSSLWELTDPPIKVQIDLEFVAYDKDQPTDWAAFSHSSSWDDLGAGIKGVFHKYIIQSFTKLTTTEFLLRKLVGRGKARVEQDVPTTDNMFSFAVSSKEGGGLRPKYEPVTDEKGKPLVVDGLPVMRALPASGYEQDIGKIFQSIFGKRIAGPQLKKLLPKTWSFTGLLEIMNLVLSPEEKEQVVDAFVDKLFAPGAQGLYKNDADRDISEKNVALNKMIATLKVTPPKNLEQMRHDYKSKYRMTTEGPIGLDQPVAEAGGEEPKVQSQLRKGMPHLRDLKPADFLDLVDEMKDKGGRFKLQNIPLNVKIDGFGGRLGKNADGKPFMGTSRTEPRYQAGFVKYHQEKGTNDPEILGRAANFDKLFYEMMAAIKAVDSKLGPDALVDRQITCEVLFLPFATQTEEGKLKFVGIEYDQLPQGVDLVLVPFRVVEASTGEDVPDADKLIQALTDLGQNGSVMFMSNKLVQKKGLDVTEIINPLENLEELKSIVSGTAGKRDRASIQLRREVEEKLKPVQIALEKAIDEDPNIVGKDILGQDYEGIVINSRLGPIKVTSEKQKDIIVKKNAAKAAARTDQGRDNASKTAVVAIGSFVGHRGHEELFNYTINKAKEVGGDPYLFIGNAEGKDDPIPPAVKVETWHRMYPKYAKQISTVIPGGTLLQKIKHELINPLPNKPPRYDNIIIMVGEDQANMPIAGALMKAVNKFQGYEHVKVNLEVTPRGTGMSFTKLRNILKDPNATPEQQLAVWEQGFDVNKLGVDWIKHLMELTRKGMNIAPKPTVKKPAETPKPVAERLSSALIRPRKIIAEAYQNDESNIWYIYDKSSERLKQKMIQNLDEPKARSMGYRESQEDALKVAGIIRSKFNPKKFIQKQGSSWVEVFPFGQQDGKMGESQLGQVLSWPEVVNKISSAMKATGWKGKRQGEDAFMFSTKGQLDDEFYIVIIDNEGDGMFTYAMGTVEEGDPYIDDAYKGQLPTTAASVSELMNTIRDGFGLDETVQAKTDDKLLAYYAQRKAEKEKQQQGVAEKFKTGPAAHFTPKDKHVKIGQFVGGEGKIKGADGKACWDGYKYAGTKKGKDKCVPVSEDVEMIFANLINKIIINETVQNNKRRS